MGTDIRPVLSKNNRYWIEKHRYYELKHFCLQYPSWKKAYSAIDALPKSSFNMTALPKSKNISDPTAKCAEALLYYSEKIDMVEKSAKEADGDLSKYILKGVTQGIAYEYLDVPCSKNTYYDRYRKFFWILSKLRQ